MSPGDAVMEAPVAGTAARRAGLDRAALGRAAVSASGVVLLALLWEAAPRLGWIHPAFFPPLSAVLAKLGGLAGSTEFQWFFLATLRTWGLGLAIATMAGVLAGLIIGLVPGLRAITHSTIEFLRPIPSVALIPGVILIFGTRYPSGVVLITYAAFWQVLLQMLYGLKDVDAVAIDTSRTFRFTRAGYVRHVAWPTLLPFLFTGVRLAAAMALVLAVTAEMVIGSEGLGRGIMLAQSANATPEAYAYVLVAGALGVLINLAARQLELRLLRWHPSVRGRGGRA